MRLCDVRDTPDKTWINVEWPGLTGFWLQNDPLDLTSVPTWCRRSSILVGRAHSRGGHLLGLLAEVAITQTKRQIPRRGRRYGSQCDRPRGAQIHPRARFDRGYSARSMRGTFATSGARLEDIKKAAGRLDPSTTKLYHRRGYPGEKAASFFLRHIHMPVLIREQEENSV